MKTLKAFGMLLWMPGGLGILLWMCVFEGSWPWVFLAIPLTPFVFINLAGAWVVDQVRKLLK